MESNDYSFLIGTLHSGENEFDLCQKSIKNQSYRNFKHIVFSGLSNIKAHNTLYDNFMKSSESFDYFVKIDADMILEDELFLENLNKYLKSHQDISQLIIPVFDYYTDNHIYGVNIFKSSVKWNLNNHQKYYVDRTKIKPL